MSDYCCLKEHVFSPAETCYSCDLTFFEYTEKLQARCEELEKSRDTWCDKAIERAKKLAVLTECETRSDTYSKCKIGLNPMCQGCKNKKLIEDIKSD